MIAVHDLQAEIIRFVELGIFPEGRHFGPASAMGWADDSGLVAGVVFHNWDPDTQVIEISSYSTRRDWATRGAVSAMFTYPFDDLGCRMVVARHSEHNSRARRIWSALGAKEYVIADLRGDGEAECLATLRREDFKKSRFNRGARKIEGNQ